MTTWEKNVSNKGEFVREASSFRNKVTRDGESGFKAASGRYHLYVSYACPWAHRTLIVRNLKGLQDAISFDVVHPNLDANGWSFNTDFDGATGDNIGHHEFLRQIYMASNSEYSGRITVPVLFDKEKNVIVNNESSEIIQMFNSEFNEFAKNPNLDLYPENLRDKIEEINSFIYDNINNGVYKCGFARSQEAYNNNFTNLFNALERVESILDNSRYLVSDTQITLADVRLWTTLLRFDPVYVVHFKCNGKQIREYPNLWGFTKDIYQIPDVKETVRMDHIKFHYYYSHTHINPFRIIPQGPFINFDEPHNRHSKTSN